jgi:hypothetical protein
MDRIAFQNEVADHLSEVIGIHASNEDTGGGLYCIVVETATRLFTFGTADSRWAAGVDRKGAKGKLTRLESEALQTAVSSNCEDVKAVAQAIATALAQYDLKQSVCSGIIN